MVLGLRQASSTSSSPCGASLHPHTPARHPHWSSREGALRTPPNPVCHVQVGADEHRRLWGRSLAHAAHGRLLRRLPQICVGICPPLDLAPLVNTLPLPLTHTPHRRCRRCLGTPGRPGQPRSLHSRHADVGSLPPGCQRRPSCQKMPPHTHMPNDAPPHTTISPSTLHCAALRHRSCLQGGQQPLYAAQANFDFIAHASGCQGIGVADVVHCLQSLPAKLLGDLVNRTK